MWLESPATAPSQHRLPECLRLPASSRTSRDSAPSLPERLSVPLLYRALREAEEGRGGRKRTARYAGKCGPSVSCSHILPERGRPERQSGLRFPAALSVCFCSKKKKPHTPPPHSSHTLTHTHTHDRHAHTRAPKGKPLLAFLPHRQSCLGPSAERESGGWSRDL